VDLTGPRVCIASDQFNRQSNMASLLGCCFVRLNYAGEQHDLLVVFHFLMNPSLSEGVVLTEGPDVGPCMFSGIFLKKRETIALNA